MQTPLPNFIASITAKDGIRLAAAVYLPKGNGRFPTLFAASPYHLVPAMPIFLWRETGPIEYYLGKGYAFVHLDVRGTGRSGGEYRYMCVRLRIPVMTTMHSGAWRPLDPVDDDQGGAHSRRRWRGYALNSAPAET